MGIGDDDQAFSANRWRQLLTVEHSQNVAAILQKLWGHVDLSLTI
jgi:hypothetical protein